MCIVTLYSYISIMISSLSLVTIPNAIAVDMVVVWNTYSFFNDGLHFTEGSSGIN